MVTYNSSADLNCIGGNLIIICSFMISKGADFVWYFEFQLTDSSLGVFGIPSWEIEAEKQIRVSYMEGEYYGCNLGYCWIRVRKDFWMISALVGKELSATVLMQTRAISCEFEDSIILCSVWVASSQLFSLTVRKVRVCLFVWMFDWLSIIMKRGGKINKKKRLNSR